MTLEQSWVLEKETLRGKNKLTLKMNKLVARWTNNVSGNSAPRICRSTGQKPAGTSFATTTAMNNHARSGTPTIKMKTATGSGSNKTAP